MHVALVSHEFPPLFTGGISTYHRHLTHLLAEAGHRVTVLTSAPAEEDEEEDEAAWPGGVRIVRLAEASGEEAAAAARRLGRGLSLAARSIGFGRAARRWLERDPEAGDIEAVETIEYSGYGAHLIDESLPPVLVTCHSSRGQVRRWTSGDDWPDADRILSSLELAAIACAPAVACYSRLNQRAWEQYLGRSVHYVLPPFRRPESPPEPTRRQVGAPLRGVVVARMNNWKGILETAEAIDRCRRRKLPVEIHWIGRDQPAGADGIGSVRQHLEERYPEIWGSSFRWTERLTREEVRRAQTEADFALVPSRWDTFNFTVPEAMATATPVVVSRGAGAHEIVGDGGLLVPPEDPEALVGAFERLLDDDLRCDLGRAAWQTLGSALSPERVVNSHLEAYAAAGERQRFRRRAGWCPSLLNPVFGDEIAAVCQALERASTRSVLDEAWRRLIRRGPRDLFHKLKRRLR